MSPQHWGARYGLGFALKRKGLKREAKYEFSEFLRLARASLKESAEVYERLDETSYAAQSIRKGSEKIRKRVDEVEVVLRELEE